MDLFHYGHVDFLKRVKTMAMKDDPKGAVIVGLHSDKDVESYKRRPVMTMKERIAVVEACRFVDHVIGDAPLRPTTTFLSPLQVDLVVHAKSDSSLQDMMYGEVIKAGMFQEIEYTEGISTTEIIERIKSH